MADIAPDPVRVYLAEVRGDLHSGYSEKAIGRIREQHIPALLAMVEGVLAPHEPGRVVILGGLCARHESHRHFSITSTEAADVAACPDCTAAVYVSCAGCGLPVRWDSCPVRKAITCELPGGDSGA